MKYCTKCIMPETHPVIKFNESGVCGACRFTEFKETSIDWDKKREELVGILDRYRSKDGSNYDCIIPVSGGKDSTFQVYTLKEKFGMNPLCVCYKHEWFSDVGEYNLDNLTRTLGADLIIVSPKKNIIRDICRLSLPRLGDLCWHCHRGCYTVPAQIAVKYKIPLIIYGEDQRREYGYGDHTVEYEMFDKYEQYEKLSVDDLIAHGIPRKDLLPYFYPPKEELQKLGVRGINLGNYVKWNVRKQVDFIKRELGWRGAGYSKATEGYLRGGKCEGTLTDYQDVECLMEGFHNYLKYLKFGYGRATDDACMAIRLGLMGRDEAMKAVEIERSRPKSLDWALNYLGMTEKELIDIIKGMRDNRLAPLGKDTVAL